MSPIIPAVLSAPAVWGVILEGAPLPLGAAAEFFGAYLLAAEIWALISGSVCVFGIFRQRGGIGRSGCLLLGAVGGFTFPLAICVAGSVLRSPADAGPFAFAAMIGLFALPFGILGGWIFWRISVRPAVAATPDVVQVFD